MPAKQRPRMSDAQGVGSAGGREAMQFEGQSGIGRLYRDCELAHPTEGFLMIGTEDASAQVQRSQCRRHRGLPSWVAGRNDVGVRIFGRSYARIRRAVLDQ
jgi:hypothetical protein